MSKALISTLVAAAFAASAPAGAHTRELIFGPPIDTKPSISESGSQSAVTKKPLERTRRQRANHHALEQIFGPPLDNVAIAAVSTPYSPTTPTSAQSAGSKTTTLNPGPAAAQAAKRSVLQDGKHAAATPSAVLPAAAGRVPASQAVQTPDVAVVAAPKQNLVIETVPATPELEAPRFSTTAADEHAIFQKLQKSLDKGTIIGILPGISQVQRLRYSNNADFLPLINHLSSKVGFLITPVYETSVAEFRRRILEGRYPMIHIAGSMSDAAVKGGYEPLVANTVGQPAVFLVRADSQLKTVAGLANTRVALPARGAAPDAALAALIRAGIQDKVTLADMSTEFQAFEEMVEGRADVAIVSSGFADVMDAKRKKRFKVVGRVSDSMSYAYWVHKGAYDSATKARLVSLLSAVNADPTLEQVRAGLKRATNTDTNYVPLTEEAAKTAIQENELVTTKWPGFTTSDASVSDEAVVRNKALPIFFSLSHLGGDSRRR